MKHQNKIIYWRSCFIHGFKILLDSGPHMKKNKIHHHNGNLVKGPSLSINFEKLTSVASVHKHYATGILPVLIEEANICHEKLF
jgi:hypothetical protein